MVLYLKYFKGSTGKLLNLSGELWVTKLKYKNQKLLKNIAAMNQLRKIWKSILFEEVSKKASRSKPDN